MSVLSKWVFGALVAGAFVLGSADRAQAQPGRGGVGGSRGGAGCHSGGMGGMNSMSARPGNSQMTAQMLMYQRSQWQAQLQQQQMLAQQQQWQQMQAQQAAWQQQQLMADPRAGVQQRQLQAR